MSNSDFLELDLSQADYDTYDARFDEKIDELHQWAEMLMENLNKRYEPSY